MPTIARLVGLLPTLALLGLALTGIDNVPSALAHGSVRSSNDHHRHLAARHRAESSLKVHARQDKRNSVDNRLLKRKADGSVCRVRGQTGTFSSSVTTTSSTALSTSTRTSAASSSSSTTDSNADGVAAVQVASTTTTSTTSSSDGLAAYANPQTDQQPSTSSTSSAASGGSTNSVSVTLGSGGWTNTNSKLGAAWPNGDWASSSDANYIGNYIGSKTAWYYTWNPFCVSSADKLGLEFVPHLWGPSHVSDWWAQMGSWPHTVKNALFFNEPNDAGQSNIAAGDAVQYWMNDFVPLRSKGVRLGGAATTSAATGLEWIQAFSAACTNYGNAAADCKMDFVPVHFYYTDVANFKNYVANFHAKTGLNIWVTEYACQSYVADVPQCSESETWAMHQEMAAWFDQQDYVERYSPFGMMTNMQGVNEDNALMDAGGGITDLGRWYINSA